MSTTLKTKITPRLEWNNAAHRWEVTYLDPKGKRRVSTTSTSDHLEAARFYVGFLEKHYGEVPTSVAVSKIVDQYLDYLALRHTKAKRAVAVSQLRAVTRLLGTKRPSDLTPSVLEQYIRDRKVAPITAQRELSHLKSAVNRAIKEKMIPVNETFDLPKSPAGKKRVEFITPEQADQLLAFFGEGSPPNRFTRIALSTGARREAICDLTWDQVDFDSRLIFFANPHDPVTNKRRAIVPMTNELLSRMDWWLSSSVNHRSVVGIPPNGVTECFRHASNALGFKVTPHMLRHSVVTWLMREGVDLLHISKLTGMSVQMVTSTYGHFQSGWLTPTVQRLEGLLGGQNSSA